MVHTPPSRQSLEGASHDTPHGGYPPRHTRPRQERRPSAPPAHSPCSASPISALQASGTKRPTTAYGRYHYLRDVARQPVDAPRSLDSRSVTRMGRGYGRSAMLALGWTAGGTVFEMWLGNCELSPRRSLAAVVGRGKAILKKGSAVTVSSIPYNHASAFSHLPPSGIGQLTSGVVKI